jgi:hypothetical protein
LFHSVILLNFYHLVYISDHTGEIVYFPWNDREWDAFGRYAVNNKARFFGRVLKAAREEYGRIFVNVELQNPARDNTDTDRSSYVLDPITKFWLK